MECSSQKDFQTNEFMKKVKENNVENNEKLHISLWGNINEENQEDKVNVIKNKKSEENIFYKIEENQDKKEEEIIIQQAEENLNQNEEEEITKDIGIQEDEFHRILVGGADSLDKIDKYNSKADNSNRISISKRKRKKPFIVTVIEDYSYKKIKIVFNANSFRDESVMPIWCPKDAYIKFQVKGKWRIDRLYPFTDSKGLPSNNNGGFGYGALVGSIGNGDKFVVSNDKAVIVKEEGPLIMKQILPKNMKIEPEGSVEVNVYDGEYMDIEEINQKIGWKENNTINGDENNQEENNEKIISKKKMEENRKLEFEKKIRNELNNLRMNPLISYDKYIGKTKNITQTRKYLEIFNNLNLPALNPIDEYYNDIFNYFKLFAQNKSITNLNQNNLMDYLTGLEGEIGYYLSDKFGTNVKVKCKLTKKTNPRDIVIQCFYDKKYRFYIFNKRSKDLTVNIFKNYYKDYTLIIMAFTFENNS